MLQAKLFNWQLNCFKYVTLRQQNNQHKCGLLLLKLLIKLVYLSNTDTLCKTSRTNHKRIYEAFINLPKVIPATRNIWKNMTAVICKVKFQNERVIINRFWLLLFFSSVKKLSCSKCLGYRKESMKSFSRTVVKISTQLHLHSGFLKIPSNYFHFKRTKSLLPYKTSVNIVLSFMYNCIVTSNIKYLHNARS